MGLLYSYWCVWYYYQGVQRASPLSDTYWYRCLQVVSLTVRSRDRFCHTEPNPPPSSGKHHVASSITDIQVWKSACRISPLNTADAWYTRSHYRSTAIGCTCCAGHGTAPTAYQKNLQMNAVSMELSTNASNLGSNQLHRPYRYKHSRVGGGYQGVWRATPLSDTYWYRYLQLFFVMFRCWYCTLMLKKQCC